ncbi:MAG: LUD domain-containing protein [Planctomycetota bacterium]
MTELSPGLREALTDSPALGPDADPIEAFVERARSAGVQIYPVDEGGDRDAVVGEILASIDPADIALSSDPEARQACLYFGAGAVSGSTDQAVLERCAVGVTRARAAVADLGAVVLERDADEHRLGTLVPEVFIALVDRADVVRRLGDVRSDSAAERLAYVVGPGRAGSHDPLVRSPSEVHVVLFDA